MALERPVLIHGSVMTHHEVERITHICGETTVIDVLSWIDSTKADIPVRSVFSVDYDSGMDETDAYAYVSDLPEYEEYIDPNKEAVDELLPILTDEQAEQVTNVHPSWEAGVAYAVGKRVKHDGKLYRCVQAHTSQEGWEPPVTPALWVRTAPEGEIPVWVQPTGAQDAYNKGDKVHYPGAEGPVYVSLIDANVYSPLAYPQGWELVSGGGE